MPKPPKKLAKKPAKMLKMSTEELVELNYRKLGELEDMLNHLQDSVDQGIDKVMNTLDGMGHDIQSDLEMLRIGKDEDDDEKPQLDRSNNSDSEECPDRIAIATERKDVKHRGELLYFRGFIENEAVWDPRPDKAQMHDTEDDLDRRNLLTRLLKEDIEEGLVEEEELEEIHPNNWDVPEGYSSPFFVLLRFDYKFEKYRPLIVGGKVKHLPY